MIKQEQHVLSLRGQFALQQACTETVIQVQLAMDQLLRGWIGKARSPENMSFLEFWDMAALEVLRSTIVRAALRRSLGGLG